MQKIKSLLVFSWGLVFTLTPMIVNAEEGSCTVDVEKFCHGIQPGDGRIQRCLNEHRSELSAGCKTEPHKEAKRGRRTKIRKRKHH